MAGLIFFVAVVVALVMKDGALPCSLRSHNHKSDSSPCLSSAFDAISIPHHIIHSRPDTVSSPSEPTSAGSSIILPSLPNFSVLQTKSTHTPASSLSVPGSVILSSHSGYNIALLNYVIKLLESSSANTTSPSLQISTPSPSFVLSLSTSNLSPVSGQISKPNFISSPCESSSGLSSSSSVACGSVPPLSVSPIPGQQLAAPTLPPTSNSLPTSGDNSDLTNDLFKMSSLVNTPTGLPDFKRPLFSPLRPLFKPVLNTKAMPTSVSKSHITSQPCVSSSGLSSFSPSVLSDLPLSSSTYKPTVLETDLSIIKKPVPETVTKPALEELPNPVPTPALVQAPVQVPTHMSTLPTFSDNNSTIINILLKLLLCTQATNVSSDGSLKTLPTNCSLITPTLNATSVIAPALKPPTNLECVESSDLNPCLSKNQSSSLSDSTLPPKLTSDFVTPTPIPVPVLTSTSGVSFSYNPDFMKLLIKHLWSTVKSYHSLRNPHLTSTVNRPVNNLNHTVSNLNHTEGNKSSDSTPTPAPALTIIQNVSSRQNSSLINLLNKLVLSSTTASEKPLKPLSLSSHSVFASTSTISSSSLTSDLVTPLPFTNSFPKPVQNIIPKKIPEPTPLTSLWPSSPLSGLNPCHLKLLRPQKLSSHDILSSANVSPCHHKILKPFTTPSPLTSAKLSTGC